MKFLCLGGNHLSDVPVTLGMLDNLKALNLSDNSLESLPPAIANLKHLKSLMLHKNRLRTLPVEIISLKCLTEVNTIKKKVDLCLKYIVWPSLAYYLLTWAAEQCHGLHEDICILCTLLRYNWLSEYSNIITFKKMLHPGCNIRMCHLTNV